MTITRVTGQRHAVASPTVTVASPAISSNFARQLESQRGRTQPGARPTPMPTRRGQAPANKPAPAPPTPSRPTTARSSTVQAPLAKVSQRKPGAAQGGAPGLDARIAISRAVAHMLPFARAQRALQRSSYKFGLVNETVISIEGLGDIVVSLYRTAAGWVVRVDPDSLVGCLSKRGN